MSISWSFGEQRGVAVMSVAGFLGSSAVDRFSEGFGWVAARSTGAVVLDLTELLGWSTEGKTAVLQTAAVLGANERALAVCGLDRLEATHSWADQADSISVYPDLNSALDAHTAASG
ncbi:anti-sigma factor antagonist [Streptomyces sp. NBC_01750]|uniref:anti-sigma factor antagonist n=1 Tax=Streptomyces sp. NBC_01750 TaxID=2975928 RepID=UPI002DDB275C|nr:anti-sigma factor antagonist [Streptomyces sp. NBC_01750]WSD37517.1 anti-sigma factor antagonist [Streptomyces sp. NBC_01750]